VVDDAIFKSSLDAQVQTREGDKAQGGGQAASSSSARAATRIARSSSASPRRACAAVSRGDPKPVPVTIRIDARLSKLAFDGTGTTC
jgi:hypothetical protein